MLAAHLMICYSAFSVTRNLWSEETAICLTRYDYRWTWTYISIEFGWIVNLMQKLWRNWLWLVLFCLFWHAYSAFTLVMASSHRAIGSMPSWDTEVTSYSACFGWLLLQTGSSGFVFLIIWLLLLGFHERQNLYDISLFCIQLSCTVVNSVSS
jgi:hypothetical protein